MEYIYSCTYKTQGFFFSLKMKIAVTELDSLEEASIKPLFNVCVCVHVYTYAYMEICLYLPYKFVHILQDRDL